MPNLVFIDESGDSGWKIDKGSSRFFTIGLVVFDDTEEAIACDKRISLLKRELGWNEDDEFHFSRNTNNVRIAFLRAVARYNFFYYGIVINKNPIKLWAEGFQSKESFYKYACGLVFENAKDKLNYSIITIDESGSLEFKGRLAKYLNKNVNKKEIGIKKVKMQRSQSSNLLQLADYIAGIINRSVNNKKKDGQQLEQIIIHRKINVQIWPQL